MNRLQFYKHVGIRAKFVVSFSVLLIGCIVIISSYLIKRQSEGYRRELEASGETLTRLLAMQSESGVLFESTFELDEVLKQLEAFEDVHYAVIKNAEGRILGSAPLCPKTSSSCAPSKKVPINQTSIRIRTSMLSSPATGSLSAISAPSYLESRRWIARISG